MSRQLLVIATIGTAAVGGSAEGGFLGFVAFAKQSGSYVVVDVFAAVGNASDRFLNVYNANISTTNAGGFNQAGGAARGWKPDAGGFNYTRNSIDSFMTAGTYSGGAYGNEYYPNPNTNGDPWGLWGPCWDPPPGSPACTTVPPNVGWYTGDPTSVDKVSEALIFAGYGRIDSGPTAASGNTNGSVGTATATRGIWCSHLVVAGTLTNFRIDYSASASIKDGMTGATSQGISTLIIPAPGAIALLGVGGIAVRRRRR
jgi:hypothetical protein